MNTIKDMERRSGLYSLFSNIKKSFFNTNKSFNNINKSFININKSFININKYDEHLLILINDFLIASGLASWGPKGPSSRERAFTATGVSKERPKI